MEQTIQEATNLFAKQTQRKKCNKFICKINPTLKIATNLFAQQTQRKILQQIDLQNRHNAKNCHANAANSENRLNIMERTELNSSDMIRSNSPPHRYSYGKGTHLYVFINQSHLLICLRVSKTHREMSLFSAGGVLVIVYKENQTFPFFLVNGEYTMGHISNVSSYFLFRNLFL